MLKLPKGLFVAGTDTEIGKTYITCQLLRQYRNAGINAVGMKPVASGLQKVNGQWVNDDVEQIRQASGAVVDRGLINQYAFRPFIAPHLAAAQAGRPISMQMIGNAYGQLAKYAELVIVEGAGGLMTPLSDTETFIDLIRQLQLGVVLVVAIRLGCINHSLLSQAALSAAGLSLAGWVANYPDAEHSRDQDTEESLKTRLHAPLLGVVPWCSPSEQPLSLDLGQLE